MTANLPAVPGGPSPQDRAAALVAEFVATRRSQNTRDAYRRDLGRWLDWCQGSGVDPATALPAHVQRWLSEMDGANTSKTRRVSSVSSWYRWLNEQRTAAGLAPAANPADIGSDQRPEVDWLHSPTVGLPRALVVELQELADADHHSSGLIVCALLHTGMRVSELVTAAVTDVAADSGGHVLFVTRKGGRRDRLPLSAPLVDRIDRHLEARGAQPEVLPTTTAGAKQRVPLVVNRHGRDLSRLYVWRLLRRLAAQGSPDLAAQADRIHPHVARHTAATDLLRDDRPLADIAELLGHRSVNTTRRYAHADGRGKRVSVARLAEMYTPRDGGDS